MGFVSFDKYQAMNNLARYSTGVAVNREEEPSGIASGTLFMSGISGATWTWKNRKDLKGAWKTLAKEATKRDNIVKSTKVFPEGSKFSKIKNLWAGAGKYVKAQELKAATNATGKATTTTVANAAKTAGKFSKITKFIKGNAVFAAISLAVAAFTDIIPAFKMGTDKGFKQLGKSTVKTAAEVGGWAAGTAIGAKAGAAFGTWIGGPIGTIVGGVLGAAFGFAGSWLASKLADKAVGPSEVEIAQEETAKQVAKEAKNNAETQDSVIGQSLQNLVANYAQTGQLSEDDKTAKESLEKVIGEELNLDELAQQYKATEQEQAQTTAPQDTTAPSAEQQSLQRQAQQEAEAQRQSQLAALQQQTTTSQVSSTQESDEAEEPQGKKDKKKTKSTQLFSTPMTAYSSPLNNPFMTSSNNFSMANPYGTMSGMSNPYVSTFDSTSTQSAQATDPSKFVYNPKA